MPREAGGKLAVLASGRGTNFCALADAATAGRLGGAVALLLCDREGAPVLEEARRRGIPARRLDPGPRRTRLAPEAEREYVRALREHGVDTVLLAGFMRVLHEDFLTAFPESVLNVHPSLLPAFPGLDAPRRALEHGVTQTGCTIHLVEATVDGGPILAQTPVPVRSRDDLESLTARIHESEHRLYPETVRRFLTVPWRREGRRIHWEDA